MAARRSWADLPADLVAEIARRVPCLTDRVRAARACRTWLEGALKDPCPLKIPWLLLPADALPPDAIRRASFFCVLCNRAHRVAVPNDMGGARFFGAYPGGWLFLAYGQSCRHGLINLRTHESLYLPDNAVTFDESASNRNHPMLIRAATLSAPPAPLEGCVAAAIVTDLTPDYFFDPVHITLWRMGSRLGSTMFQFDAEDVIYHNGAFHFLSQHGDLLICRPEFQDEAPLERLQVRREYHPMVGVGFVLNAGACYLVECRGELLMVMRVQPHQDVTSQFKVYRMTQDQAQDADQAFYRWTELPALDGRMLFIGRGCSRSFEAAHFPGSQEGIYFFDDGNFYSAPIICVGDKPPQYGCCKNGVWSGPPDHVRYWFPEQRPSTYSSPVWFLH
ncbi:hypothetical protein SETIT_3G141100v2 [Setaria italica]|uniref:KIB1-4 beta-propeller domain-containing protein n=1 Tax=Setaria italica TaxID=4555 RepID=K3ZDM7_SETIT|nr:F-box/kelch-repeat protein At1g57790 [Setaria italica]RCV16473.1 hypothetical protein SETIT_3G141100v2 [Setaria italica]